MGPTPPMILTVCQVLRSSEVESDDTGLDKVSEHLLERANLSGYLFWIWRQYFTDIPQANTVTIKYGYPWKSRLGRIRLSLDGSTSLIEINTLLQTHWIPEDVLLATIVHELVHYAHGFGSPLPRKYVHPHANHVVSREFEQRGLAAWLQCCETWVNQFWYAFYDEQRASGWSDLTWWPRSGT